MSTEPYSSVSDRRSRVRYEDLVRDPLETMRKLYDVLGIPFTLEAEGDILGHFGLGIEKKDSKVAPITTYRNLSNFDPNHWRISLKPSRISQIEDSCQYVMNVLDYPLEDSSS